MKGIIVQIICCTKKKKNYSEHFLVVSFLGNRRERKTFADLRIIFVDSVSNLEFGLIKNKL